jgi:tetratricopeptide (TPR) repeat protein
MKRFYKYELLDIVRDGSVTTYSAREIASGSPVLFHMVAPGMDATAREDLLGKARSLVRGPSQPDSSVLDVGEYVGFRYVVTEVVDAFTNLSEWVDRQHGLVSAQAMPGAAEVAVVAGNPIAAQQPAALAETRKMVAVDGDAAGLKTTRSPQPPEIPQPGTLQPIEASLEDLSSVETARSARSAQQAPGAAGTTGDSIPTPETETTDWHRAARQHLEARAFTDALNALDHVLKVNPADTEALRLREEVKQQEAQSPRTKAVSHPAPPAGTSLLPDSTGAAASRAEEALMILSQGQALYGEGRADEGLELLRRARECDPSNPLIPIVLAPSLMQRAVSLSGKDWEAVERLTSEVLEVQPVHAAARSLRDQAVARQKEQFVLRCRGEACRLQAGGDLEGALLKVAEGLRRSPGDMTFLALHADLEEAREQAAGDPEITAEATKPDPAFAETRVNHDTAATIELQERLRQLVRRYGDDSDMQALADEILERSRDETATQEEQDEVDETWEPDRDAAFEDEADQFDEVPPAVREYAQEAATATAPLESEHPLIPAETVAAETADSRPPGASAKKDLKVRIAPGPRLTAVIQACTGSVRRIAAGVRGLRDGFMAPGERNPRRILRLVLIALAVLVLLATALTTLRKMRQGGVAEVVSFPVRIQSQPGAVISVDGVVCGTSDCAAELAAGSHSVTVQLAGFAPGAATIDIDAKVPPGSDPLVVTLTPLSPLFRASSNLGRGQVLLDGRQIAQFEDGEFEIALDSLAPGPHTLRIVERDTAATFDFEVTPGSLPVVRSPVQTRNVKAVVVAALGGAARVYGNPAAGEVRLAGEKVGAMTAEGLVLEDLAEGLHEISIGTGREQQTLSFDAAPQPMLVAYLTSDRNVGGLRLATNEDGVTIYLNGERYRNTTQRGGRLIYLVPKSYTVRVEKDGFEPPAEQVAEVRKGEQVQLKFELKPLPQVATLRVRGGVPGAEVALDGRLLGTVRSDGSFSASNVQPGTHAIRLAKQYYRTKQLEREFASAGVVEVDGSLERSVGTLRIQVLPETATARLRLRREGETAEQAISDRTLYLEPGTYTVTAAAEGFQEYAATVRLQLNEVRTISLVLQPNAEVEEVRPALLLEDWEKAGGWRRESKVLVRAGGGFVLAPDAAGHGVYTFTARALRGAIQWVADYTDANNYVLCEINKNQFERVHVVNGDKKERFRVRHGVNGSAFVSVKAEVMPNAIVHKVLRGTEWVVVDTFPLNAAGRGKFGFYLPGRDELGLSFFDFFPGILVGGD